jgi:hypothetical protein
VAFAATVIVIVAVAVPRAPSFSDEGANDALMLTDEFGAARRDSAELNPLTDANVSPDTAVAPAARVIVAGDDAMAKLGAVDGDVK